MSRYIVKLMYLDKPERLAIWNGESINKMLAHQVNIDSKPDCQLGECNVLQNITAGYVSVNNNWLFVY